MPIGPFAWDESPLALSFQQFPFIRFSIFHIARRFYFQVPFSAFLPEFKSSARRRHRCTLLFAQLLMNAFKKQIFACMRSTEAIYIIFRMRVRMSVFCILKEDIASIYNVSSLQHTVLYTIHYAFRLHTSFMGSLNVTINSDEFVDICQPEYGAFMLSSTHSLNLLCCVRARMSYSYVCAGCVA